MGELNIRGGSIF